MSDIITFDTELMSGTKTYAPYNFIPETDPILKTKAQPFVFEGNNAEELSGRLKATIAKAKGLGLAAPQCGLPYRVFCMGAEGNYTTLFNPEIISRSEEIITLEEGCLSFPFLVLSINRPKSIIIRFQDEKQNWQQLTLEGLSARIALHEYDHLEGITFDTLAKPLALKMGKKKREKNVKRYARYLTSQRIIANEKSR